MAKTAEELRKEILELLEDIKKSDLSFEIAELSQKISEVIEEWKKIKKAEEKVKEQKPEPEDVEILLNSYVDIIMPNPSGGCYSLRIKKNDVEDAGIRLAIRVLTAIMGLELPSAICAFDLIVVKAAFRDLLIKILEEKFGFIRYKSNCGNCEYLGRVSEKCSNPWILKEIPEEKKEEEKK